MEGFPKKFNIIEKKAWRIVKLLNKLKLLNSLQKMNLLKKQVQKRKNYNEPNLRNWKQIHGA